MDSLKIRLQILRNRKRFHINAIRLEKNLKGARVLAENHKEILLEFSKDKHRTIIKLRALKKENIK